MMDERQKSAVNAAMAKVLVIVYTVMVIAGVLKFLANFRIADCWPELAVAIAAPLLVLWFMRRRKKTHFPMSLAGLAIEPDRTQAAKWGRVKAYALDSLQWMLTMAVIHAGWDLLRRLHEGRLGEVHFSEWLVWLAALLGECALYFIIFFAWNYLIYEIKSRRYCNEHRQDGEDAA